MKNYEKYADEIKEYKGVNFCKDFVKPNILESDNCGGLACGACYMLQTIWLLEDYEEPETDWSKVEVDTPMLVRNDDYATTSWLRRHFAKYENGLVYAWKDSRTSWTANNMTTAWQCAKLAESEEE